MKKILSLAISFIIALTVVPFYANAEGNILTVGVAMGNYDTLAKAVTAATDGDTIKLLENITATGITLNKSITIDTNGYVWTGGTSSKQNCATVSGNVNVTIINSQRQTQVNDSATFDIVCNSSKNSGVFVLTNSSTLNMTNIAAKSTNAYDNNQPCIIYMQGCTSGKLNLNNCYFTSSNFGAIGINDSSAPQITAKNSIFSGKICSIFLLSSVATSVDSNLSFDNCSFLKPITALNANNASAANNSITNYKTVYYNFKNCTGTDLYANASTATFEADNSFTNVFATIILKATDGTSIYSDSTFETALNQNEALTINSAVYTKKAPTQYAVTIDSTKIADVLAGTNYTLPESTDKWFVAYTDGSNYYDAGSQITVNSNISLTSVSIGEVKMSYGAAMRLAERSGIRFYTNVNTDKLISLRDAGASIEMGTLIAPQNLIADNLLTLDIAEENRLKIDYTVGIEKNLWFQEGSGESSFKGMVGSIVNIRKTTSETKGNENRKYIGRGYVKVSLSGITKTFYADYYNNDISNSTRTVSYIANALRNDTENYNALSDKSVVDYFADLYSSAQEY